MLDGGAVASTLLQYFVNSPEYQAKANPVLQSALASFGVAVIDNPALDGQSLISFPAPVGGGGVTIIGSVPNGTSVGESVHFG